MLGEADLVGIFGVRVVGVDSLGTIRVLGWLRDLAAIRVDGRGRCGVTGGGTSASSAEARLCGVALGTGGSAGITGDRGRSLEAAQLGRGIHLGSVAGCHSLWTSTERAGHGTATAIRSGLFLVQGKGVDETAVRGLRGGSEVEDPNDDDHGQEDETSAGGLFSALGAVDRVVGTDGSQDKGSAQVTHNGDTINIAGVGTEDED